MMTATEYWRDLESRFQTLHRADIHCLTAQWISTFWIEPGEHWKISYRGINPPNLSIRNHFRVLAESAAVRLGHAAESTAESFWLDEMRRDSPNYQGGGVYEGVHGKAEWGFMEFVCGASASFCLKCETRELLNGRPSPSAPSSMRAERKRSLDSYDGQSQPLTEGGSTNETTPSLTTTPRLEYSFDSDEESKRDITVPRKGRLAAEDSSTTDLDNGRVAKQSRAMTVAILIDELDMLKPQMFEDEKEYENLRAKYPKFLTFNIAAKRPDLKTKILGIRSSTRHFRLAQELAGAKHNRQLSTIQDDWKDHKPESFRRPKK